MKVWILQTGEPIHSDSGNPRPMRAMNLADALVSRGHEVTLWTSAFYHQEKRHRALGWKEIRLYPNLTIRLIPSGGYDRNIGLKRLIDHGQLSINLRAALKSEELQPPDIAFIGYPPIEVAYIMTRWLKKKKIPTILDVKDFWPQIFVEVFPAYLRPIARIIFSPYFLIAKKTIKSATVISSMTESFLTELMDFSGRKRSPLDTVLPLSQKPKMLSPNERTIAREWWARKGLDLSHQRRFIFVGSLSRAFDFKPVVEAVIKVRELYPDFELVICGAGEEREALKDHFGMLDKVFFPGWINSESICFLMQNSLATLAPYKNISNFTKNFPNKIIDSLSYGVPVITSLDGEVRRFVDRFQVGFFCEYSADAWADSMLRFLNNPALHRQMASKSLSAYETHFSFDSVYGCFVEKLEGMGSV